MKLSDFFYELPDELIAQEPRQRGKSRMLVVEPGEGAAPLLRHDTFDHFPELISPGDVVVLNDTRVFPARLFAEPKGNMERNIEVLLTHRRAPLVWESWCRPGRRIRTGDVLRFSDLLTAEVVEKEDDGTVVMSFDAGGASMQQRETAFWSEVEAIGKTPLPPYIRVEDDATNREAYQTVYAAVQGAVAAPTAGLHFTEEILRQVEARGAAVVRITLHVGAGTFQPVKVEDIAQHRMHEELYSISEEAAATLNEALRDERRIVAIGTTTVRALESAVREGEGEIAAGESSTDIFITPGYRFGAVSALLTNFHLPESTLLMLVSAFAGVKTIRYAYREAIAEKYYFYSFGDCMFIASTGSE